MFNKILAEKSSGIELVSKKILGINGFGRIGKLTGWVQAGRKYFDEVVVNLGRDVGLKSETIQTLAEYIRKDSTYGSLITHLGGYRGKEVISDLDEENSSMRINGVKFSFLRKARKSFEIDWKSKDVRLVVDTTGQFLNPILPETDPKSIRGHFVRGAEKVIVSAPFKGLKIPTDMPVDAVMTVMGINENAYDPRKHTMISNASCTTTCLAHMMKPLFNYFGGRILTATMATVHAATGTQAVLDKLPNAGATDLRKTRGILNNIILTSTGAADALRFVIPEMQNVGFTAESIRIPTNTGSLVMLCVNLQPKLKDETINRKLINDIYQLAADFDPRGYLQYTETQNVSSDIIGQQAASIIEGHETHTRTSEMVTDLRQVPGINLDIISKLSDPIIRIPVTQAVIYAWYDNEMGSYTNLLADRTISIFELMQP